MWWEMVRGMGWQLPGLWVFSGCGWGLEHATEGYWRAGPFSKEPRQSPPPGAVRIKTLRITDAVWDSSGCGETSAM